MPFQNLNLSKEILQALEKLGFESPTPIQSASIPVISSGKDLKASANTGTGKTAAFLIPALQRVTPKPKEGCGGPRVIILVPTRELAMQVSNEALKLSRFLPKVKTVCVYGGVPFPKQKKQLSRKVDILIATPGRFIDHLRRGKLDVSSVEMFVLDEADRMLDMGFYEPVQEIYSSFKTHPQTLLFSATLEGPVMKLAKTLLQDPESVSVASQMTKHEDIKQHIHHADDLPHKKRMLNRLLTDEEIHQAIIFTSTKRFAEELVTTLRDNGHYVAPLHGDMCQRQRTRTMKRMRDGKIKILVATDVAARGLDVNTISHVFNFDLPTNAEDYVHRIGRTGRAGAKGVAISFVSSKDRQFLKQIEKFTNQKLEALTITGLEPKKKNFDAQPPKRGNKSKHTKPPFARRGSKNKAGHSKSAPWNRREQKRKRSFKKKAIAA